MALQCFMVCQYRDFSNVSCCCCCCCCLVLSRVRLSAAPWTVTHQAPLSMEFSRQEYWSGLLFPTPGDLLYLAIEPSSLTSPALADGFFTPSATWEAHHFTVFQF